MREVVDGIFTWPWFSERHGYNFNGYFVRHPAGNLCIDPVAPGDDVLATLAREGVAHILITNRNHVRQANLLRERTGAQAAIHPADAAYARGQGAMLDAELHAGARVGPFVVVAAPGKSPGEVALHWPERRLLVVGDAVVGNPPGRLSLLPTKVIDDLPGLQRSIRALAQLDVDTLLVGDGEVILHGAGAALGALIASLPA